MSTNKSGTFVYTPDIVVGIQTNTGYMDVSSNLIDFTLTRQVNSIATFNCTLANPGRKYNRVINTMDRITVFLKRTSYVQVFSGYVTYAPIETLVPTPITISAQCTLRILKVTYWDDTLIQFQQLLLNYMDAALTSAAGTTNDGGVSQVIAQVLNRVCGWDPNKIHVQSIPQSFVDFAAKVYSSQIANDKVLDQNVIQEISQLIGQKGIVSGNDTSTTNINYSPGQYTIVTNKTSPEPTLTQFSVSQAHSFYCSGFAGGKDNSPGSSADNPVAIADIGKDIYWCSAPFAYFKGKGLGTLEQIAKAKTWLAYNNATKTNDGQLLELRNPSGTRVICVRVTSVPQKPGQTKNGKAVGDHEANYLQVHPGVVAYLNNLIDDPTSWKKGTSDGGGYVDVGVNWSKEANIKVGPQPQIEAAIKTASAQAQSAFGQTSDSAVLTTAADEVIKLMRTQLGATYPPNDTRGNLPANWRENPDYVNPKTGKKGLFDCSGLVQWAFNTTFKGSLTHPIQGNTITQFGKGDSTDADTHGAFIDVNTQPQPGDILFFNIPGDSHNPGHVVTLESAFGEANPYNNSPKDGDKGWVIAANQTNSPLSESKIPWSGIQGGNGTGKNKDGKWLNAYVKKGATYAGARRPITLLKGWSASISQNYSAANTTAANPNNPGSRASISLTGAWNNVFNAPQYDVRASVLQGTPRAFLLDNPVMGDLEQIISAGMRCYQSAPNGDFISWFPDYYGVYGTDPAIEISDVEIIDFQIYHNDDMLATHIGIIGDTNGIGQNISYADYFSTNGIVSIQDGATMQMLFGKVNNTTKVDAANSAAALKFLNKYGLRPYKQEQNMIHTHGLEYMMALWTFMNQWVQQFASNVSFTFLPELYPGMRVSIKIDNESGGTDSYQFYCTGVTHQGSRSSGFQTQATLTAPIKNGTIMHYGLDLL